MDQTALGVRSHQTVPWVRTDQPHLIRLRGRPRQRGQVSPVFRLHLPRLVPLGSRAARVVQARPVRQAGQPAA
jgi:hypothetical protein